MSRSNYDDNVSVKREAEYNAAVHWSRFSGANFVDLASEDKSSVIDLTLSSDEEEDRDAFARRMAGLKAQERARQARATGRPARVVKRKAPAAVDVQSDAGPRPIKAHRPTGPVSPKR